VKLRRWGLMSTGARVTSGPAIERAGDLAVIVSDLDQGDSAVYR